MGAIGTTAIFAGFRKFLNVPLKTNLFLLDVLRIGPILESENRSTTKSSHRGLVGRYVLYVDATGFERDSNPLWVRTPPDSNLPWDVYPRESP